MFSPNASAILQINLKLGNLLEVSRRAIEGCFVPTFRANCACVKPALTRVTKTHLPISCTLYFFICDVVTSILK